MIGTLASGTKLTLDADPLIEEKRIAGCYLGAASPDRDVPALVERYLDGELRLDELVSRWISLTDLDDGFARLREGTEALLRELRREIGLSILFITHNLALIRTIADRVCVMTGGRIVETGATIAVFETPNAEYTRQLLANTPSIEAALGGVAAR